MRPIPIALAILLLSGCVTRGSHELVEVQLDATRAALQEQTARCQEDSELQKSRIESLLDEVAERDVALDALTVERNALHEEATQYREELASVLAALPPPEDPDAEVPPPPPRSRRCPPCPEPPQPDPEELAHARGEMAAALALLTDHRVETRIIDAFYADVSSRLEGLTADGRLEVGRHPSHVRVRIPSEQLFNEGRVTLSPRGRVLVEALAEALRPAREWRIALVGHTDDLPRHSAMYPSNWELGSGEATLLMRELQDRGVHAIYRVGSAADRDPVDGGDTAEARRRNHRVELQLRPPLPAWPLPVEEPLGVQVPEPHPDEEEVPPDTAP